MIRIVLASQSPRRRALLTALGLDVEVIPSAVDEHFDGAPEEMVISNACNKRDDVAGRIGSHAIVIAADTLVFLDGEALGKPADHDEARTMLSRLAGKTHQVVTGVAVVDTSSGTKAQGAETTDVTFRNLADAEIAAFVTAVNPVDRAGAYTVDGPGSLLVAGYNGCYQNVLGLPVVRLDHLLRQVGFNLWDHLDYEKAVFL